MVDLSALAGKRLVIFGCGYIGGEVARRAARAGLRVEALTRNAERAAELTSLGVRAVVADLAQEDWHSYLTPGAEVVLDCVSAASRDPAGYRQSYVEGLRSILAWLERGPAETLLYTSSTSVYLQTDGARVEETSSVDEATPGSTRAALVEAERLAVSAAPERCRRAFVLRLAGIYGPGRHHLLDRLREGAERFPGEGAVRLNLIHRDDAAEAILTCAASRDSVPGGIFNVADGAPAPKRAVVGWLARELGLPEPGFDPDLKPSSARRAGETPDRVIVAEKLTRLTGWRPGYRDFREGYRELLRNPDREHDTAP